MTQSWQVNQTYKYTINISYNARFIYFLFYLKKKTVKISPLSIPVTLCIKVSAVTLQQITCSSCVLIEIVNENSLPLVDASSTIIISVINSSGPASRILKIDLIRVDHISSVNISTTPAVGNVDVS